MRIDTHDSLPSTNDAAKAIAAGGGAGWVLVTADEQTAGRGRQARGWASPRGNLYASFVIPKDGRVEWRRPWLLGFSAALAVADTARAFTTDGSRVSLKWPNDVLVADAKVAGLLLEAAGGHVVAGIGLNVAHAPEGTPYPATALDRHRSSPSALDAVRDHLATALRARVEDWLEHGFAEVRDAFLASSHAPGEPLTVRAGTGTDTPLTGTFAGIDAEGRLLLATATGTAAISAGDVFPGL